MKKHLFLLIFAFLSVNAYSQILIDNGALIDPALKNARFSIEGSKWNKTALTYCICNTSSKVSSSVQNTAIGLLLMRGKVVQTCHLPKFTINQRQTLN